MVENSFDRCFCRQKTSRSKCPVSLHPRAPNNHAPTDRRLNFLFRGPFIVGAFVPLEVEKRDTIRFSILDAARIAHMALIYPAKSRPEVIVQAVATRNRERTEKLAKTHGIPDIRTSYEAIRVLRAGKHVLLEAAHNCFHPSWLLFRALFDLVDVTHIAGGSLMAMGCYCFAIMREVFGMEPTSCIEYTTHHYHDGIHDKCDWNFQATSTLRGPTTWKPSHVAVTTNYIQAIAWPRIDVVDQFEVRKRDGHVVGRWTKNKSHKAYTFEEAGGQFAELPGEPWWVAYRYQLEQFVNRAKNRKTQAWIIYKDSINNMKMVDMAYEKTGLGPRPSGAFKVS
ncbi:putative oxidoreductase [Xylariaceae sp. FL1651]|nr:putative oxidoreductase [Xylariaceae sp. FL1651]